MRHGSDPKVEEERAFSSPKTGVAARHKLRRGRAEARATGKAGRAFSLNALLAASRPNHRGNLGGQADCAVQRSRCRY